MAFQFVPFESPLPIMKCVCIFSFVGILILTRGGTGGTFKLIAITADNHRITSYYLNW